MGFFFVDDSKHPSAGFCLTAMVYVSHDPQAELEVLLQNRGLVPGKDEFKSSIRMIENPSYVLLRDDLKGYLQKCKLGVAISRQAEDLYEDTTHLLGNLLRHPGAPEGAHHLFADTGIFPTRRQQAAIETVVGTRNFEFHFEQDSRGICGLQLADVAAHTSAIMMKDSLGLIKKFVKAGENSGYDPNLDMELGFEMWATIRYSFLGRFENSEAYYARQRTIENYGLQISPKLEGNIAEAARSRFGTMYIGCIH